MNTDKSMLTFSGQYVHMEAPQAASINIADIAHALSQICRFGGHTRQFYSVAQHSVAVSRLMPEPYRLHGLLHDAGEAYYGDMIQPLKHLAVNRQYRDMESLMLARIYERFGLGMQQSDECRDAVRRADLIMLATERRDLMAPDATPWPLLQGVAPRPMTIVPMMPLAAESDFLRRFKDLTGLL